MRMDIYRRGRSIYPCLFVRFGLDQRVKNAQGQTKGLKGGGETSRSALSGVPKRDLNNLNLSENTNTNLQVRDHSAVADNSWVSTTLPAMFAAKCNVLYCEMQLLCCKLQIIPRGPRAAVLDLSIAIMNGAKSTRAGSILQATVPSSGWVGDEKTISETRARDISSFCATSCDA